MNKMFPLLKCRINLTMSILGEVLAISMCVCVCSCSNFVIASDVASDVSCVSHVLHLLIICMILIMLHLMILLLMIYMAPTKIPLGTLTKCPHKLVCTELVEAKGAT